MSKKNNAPKWGMKESLMLKCFILAMIAGAVGFCLALWEKKPFHTVSAKVLQQIADQTITDYSVFIYGGGIVIVIGCILLTFAILNLMVVIHNFQIENKLIMSLFENVEIDYHPALRSALLFFLYLTTQESFQYLGMKQVLAFCSENESVQAWVILFYLFLKIILYIMAVVMISEYAYHRVMARMDTKGINSVGKVFGVLLAVGIVANTFNNFWYLLFCAAVVALWELFHKFLKKKMTDDMSLEEITKALEELDIKL